MLNCPRLFKPRFKKVQAVSGEQAVVSTDSARKNYILVILMALFVAGMIYGSLIVRSESSELFERLSALTSSYLHADGSFVRIVARSFTSGVAFIIVAYLFGYSAIAQAATVFIPMFKGLGLGLATGYLYANYGIAGAGYCLLIILPQTIVCMFAILVGCRESVKLSNLLLGAIIVTQQSERVDREVIKLYTVKFLILSIIVLVSAIIYAICLGMFDGIFKIM